MFLLGRLIGTREAARPGAQQPGHVDKVIRFDYGLDRRSGRHPRAQLRLEPSRFLFRAPAALLLGDERIHLLALEEDALLPRSLLLPFPAL